MQAFLHDPRHNVQIQSPETGASQSTTQRTTKDTCSKTSRWLDFPGEWSSLSTRKNEEKKEQYTSKDTLNSLKQTRCPGSKTTSTNEHTTNSAEGHKKKLLPIVVKRTRESRMACMGLTERNEEETPKKRSREESTHSMNSERKESSSTTSTQNYCLTPDSSKQLPRSQAHSSDLTEQSKSSQSSEELESGNPTLATKHQETASSLIKEMAGLVERTLKEITFSSMNSQATFLFQSSSNFSMDIQINFQSREDSSQHSTQESSSHLT